MIAYTYRHFSFLTFIFKLHTIKIHTECSWSVVINPFAYKQIAEEMRVENSIVYGNVHLLHLPQLMLTVVLVQFTSMDILFLDIIILTRINSNKLLLS